MSVKPTPLNDLVPRSLGMSYSLTVSYPLSHDPYESAADVSNQFRYSIANDVHMCIQGYNTDWSPNEMVSNSHCHLHCCYCPIIIFVIFIVIVLIMILSWSLSVSLSLASSVDGACCSITFPVVCTWVLFKQILFGQVLLWVVFQWSIAACV